MIKKSVVLVSSLICVSVLTGCSRGVVTTVDKSVNYQSAQSIPSLVKEPAGNIVTTSPHVNNKVKPENITASIITNKKGAQSLRINAKPVAAWDYMDAALQKAGITIYSRRYEAGMFFVGCGDEGELSTETKRRGWSFLKRKKVREAEYCGLEARHGRKKTTTVTLVDRKGEAMNNSYSADLYERILNH